MKGTLKLKLASLAVILAAAVLAPAAWAANVYHVALTSDTSGTPFVGPVTGQPGDSMILAFYVELDVEGRVPPSSSNPRIKVCNNITLTADGFTCNTYHTFYLKPGQNYTSDHRHWDSDRTVSVGTFPDYVEVRLNIAEGVVCPATYELMEHLFTYGTGVDFGDNVLSVNLPFQVEALCTDWQGCSHGYWKNHISAWPEGFDSGDMISGSFNIGSLDDMTLLQAMQFKGPGDSLDDAKRILLQQAVASLLNAADDDVNFPMTEQEVIDAVNAALASDDRDAILALKDELDAKNNLGCPLT
jgi:hypothetical protein